MAADAIPRCGTGPAKTGRAPEFCPRSVSGSPKSGRPLWAGQASVFRPVVQTLLPVHPRWVRSAVRLQERSLRPRARNVSGTRGTREVREARLGACPLKRPTTPTPAHRKASSTCPRQRNSRLRPPRSSPGGQRLRGYDRSASWRYDTSALLLFLTELKRSSYGRSFRRRRSLGWLSPTKTARRRGLASSMDM